MIVARMCLHGPRSPRCFPHQGHVQRHLPSTRRTRYSLAPLTTTELAPAVEQLDCVRRHQLTSRLESTAGLVEDTTAEGKLPREPLRARDVVSEATGRGRLELRVESVQRCEQQTAFTGEPTGGLRAQRQGHVPALDRHRPDTAPARVGGGTAAGAEHGRGPNERGDLPQCAQSFDPANRHTGGGWAGREPSLRPRGHNPADAAGASRRKLLKELAESRIRQLEDGFECAGGDGRLGEAAYPAPGQRNLLLDDTTIERVDGDLVTSDREMQRIASPDASECRSERRVDIDVRGAMHVNWPVERGAIQVEPRVHAAALRERLEA